MNIIQIHFVMSVQFKSKSISITLKVHIVNEFIPQLDYGSRGFYFVPLKCSYSKILYLFKEGDLKKPKQQKKNTLNFMIQKTMKHVYSYIYRDPIT